MQQRVGVFGFTIDGETSKDLDDAIWIEQQNEGVLLSIHIADVAAHVKKDSYIDRNAYNKIETRYRASSVSPMLPKHLAENDLSLLEKQTRDTVTVQVRLSDSAEILETRIFESELCSLRRFSYAEADAALKNRDDDFHETLKLCQLVAKKLTIRRQEQGAIAISLSDSLLVTEDGRLLAVEYKSQQIISEFMILCNFAVANTMADCGINMVYRNHSAKEIAPDRKRILESISVVASMGYIQSLLVNWMNKAEYSPTLAGHFALSIPAYCHFTSPIRRYVDLVNHRIIKAWLNGQKLPYTKAELQEIAIKATEYRNSLQEDKDAYFSGEKKKQYEKSIVSNEFKELPPKDFSRIVKYVAKQNTVETIIDEIKRRAQEKILQASDFTYLLFYAQDSNVHEIVCSALNETPNLAVSALTIQCQKEENWKIEDSIVDEGTEFCTWFVVSIDGVALTTKQGTTDLWKATSRNRAAVFWIQEYLRGSLVHLNERELPPKVESNLQPSAALCDRLVMQELTPKEFSREVKRAIENNTVESIIDEIERRGTQELLQASDFTYLLFHSTETRVHETTYSALTKVPHMAVSALMMQTQINTSWKIENSIVDEGKEFCTWFVVAVDGLVLTTRECAIAPGKAASRNQAAVFWVRDYLGDRLVNPSERALPVKVKTEVQKPIVIETVDLNAPDLNFIGLLQELVIKLKQQEPKYTFTQLGSGGFRCRCQIKLFEQEILTSADYPNKKTAKQLAAKDAYTQAMEVLESVPNLVFSKIS
ncbi:MULTISPECIES: RNB domain-containing ribonuclease [Nostocales]|uniref:RNB domain-containing ribonuclease n=3 Tax=Nostocales TaxID=1161 RepID=A0A8S9SYQ8_9CYAN|nr:RNB domain-containing ribonuclease [Tolypothrix bouteillei]KAF3884373.1 RNB domain-containing ribonuclease [Tolypothrix bouteillei VB521301]